jgi:hypothetical protein
LTAARNGSLWLAGIKLGSSNIRTQGGMMNMMEGYGMMSGAGMVGWGLYGLLWFAVASFIFAVIFWLTHNWITKKKM